MLELSARLTFMQTLYSLRICLPGESKAGSMERLIDYLVMIHGQNAVDRLVDLSFADLRATLLGLGVVYSYVTF